MRTVNVKNQYFCPSNTGFLPELSTTSIPLRHQRSRTTMVLIPLSKSETSYLVPKRITNDQWSAYWGINKIERLQRVSESALVAYGGAWLSWFLSFMAGGIVSAFVGSGLIFNWMINPWLSAYQNNQNFRKYEGKPLRHAYFKGRITSLSKIRRRSGKSIGSVSQYYLDLTICDERGRQLEIVTPWLDSYERLRAGMTIETVLASASRDFSRVLAITDSYVPSCDTWVGDYPYLQKERFLKLASTLDENYDDALQESQFRPEMFDEDKPALLVEEYVDNFDYQAVDEMDSNFSFIPSDGENEKEFIQKSGSDQSEGS